MEYRVQFAKIKSHPSTGGFNYLAIHELRSTLPTNKGKFEIPSKEICHATSPMGLMNDADSTSQK
jgi:hypothetical protein